MRSLLIGVLIGTLLIVAPAALLVLALIWLLSRPAAIAHDGTVMIALEDDVHRSDTEAAIDRADNVVRFPNRACLNSPGGLSQRPSPQSIRGYPESLLNVQVYPHRKFPRLRQLVRDGLRDRTDNRLLRE